MFLPTLRHLPLYIYLILQLNNENKILVYAGYAKDEFNMQGIFKAYLGYTFFDTVNVV